MATNQNNGKTPLVEAGCLWSRTSKANEKYLNGVLKFNTDIKAGQEIPVIVFTNKNKKAENQPDLRVYLSDKPGQSKSAPVVKTAPKPVSVETASTPEELF